MPLKKIVHQARASAVKSAPREMLEDLFEDYYKNRYQLYKMNFFRGIFFGFGGVIGGTIVVALLLWALSLFNQLPFIGNIVEAVQHSIETTKVKTDK